GQDVSSSGLARLHAVRRTILHLPRLIGSAIMAAVAIDPGAAGRANWTLRTAAIVALCFAINMADGIDVAMLSFIAPHVQADWSIGPEIMGRLFSAGLF